MKYRLEKHIVCAHCFGVGSIYPDCVCCYQNGYKTIELEFEVCPCCNNLVSDGTPADTEFNKNQIETLDNERI